MGNATHHYRTHDKNPDESSYTRVKGLMVGGKRNGNLESRQNSPLSYFGQVLWKCWIRTLNLFWMPVVAAIVIFSAHESIAFAQEATRPASEPGKQESEKSAPLQSVAPGAEKKSGSPASLFPDLERKNKEIRVAKLEKTARQLKIASWVIGGATSAAVISGVVLTAVAATEKCTGDMCGLATVILPLSFLPPCLLGGAISLTLYIVGTQKEEKADVLKKSLVMMPFVAPVLTAGTDGSKVSFSGASLGLSGSFW